MSNKKPVITIDGPGGAGKGTLCALLAQKLDYALLDSGALYRLTALAAKNHTVDITNVKAVAEVAEHLDVVFATQSGDSSHVNILLEGEDVSLQIRTEEVAALASKVAAYPEVRDALLKRQRAFAKTPNGLVADGRDMGTVVFTEAPLKIYLTASSEVRARRRVLQLEQAGKKADFEQILSDINERDARDYNREVAPLKPADDAVIIDSSDHNIEQVLEIMMAEVLDRDLA